jgi:tetraacyldisaccharide 4'-kinase
VAGASTFPDHHPFTRAECEAAAEAARRVGASCILTTAKDAIRLADQLPLALPVLALEIEIEIVEGARAVGQALGVPLEEEAHG